MVNNVIIVAGGPTVKEYDLSKLKDYGYVIGVNESFLLLDCHSGITMDRLWMESRATSIYKMQKEFWARPGATKNLDTQIKNFIKHFICSENFILSDIPNQFNGTNSGMCAVNQAMQMKPNNIFLFGFDMQQGRTPYWYKPYEWVSPTKHRTSAGRYKLWVSQFETVAKQLIANNIKTYNVTHSSGLKCFPKITFKEFIKKVNNEK